MLVSRSLFAPIFESKSRRLGLLKQAFGVRGVAKPTFRRNRNSDDFGVDFWCFLVALGAAFLTFAALETSTEIDGFSRGRPIHYVAGGGGNQRPFGRP